MAVRRKISVWALIVVLFTHILGVNVLYSLYVLDKPVFVELFCVNKDEIQLHCDGSCMLAKLDVQKDKEAAKSILLDITQFQLYFYSQDNDFDFNNLSLIDNEQLYYYPIHYNSQFIMEVFRPPILV